MAYIHINRRNFIKGVGAIGLSTLFPKNSMALDIKFDDIDFDSSIYEKNNPQTIIIYMYGGASQLAGNLTNIEEINNLCKNKYPLDNERYFQYTKDNLWANAGGNAMQRMLDSKDLNLFRTCFRTVDNRKSHGECTYQAQIGKPDTGGAGIASTISAILYNKGVIKDIDENSELGEHLQFVTMDGENTFYLEDELNVPSFLKAISINENLDNPFSWNTSVGWLVNRVLNHENNTTIGDKFTQLAQKSNSNKKIRDYTEKRIVLKKYIDELKKAKLPEGIKYPEYNSFSSRLKTAINLMIANKHTKIITLNTGGLGGWDDHSNAIDKYTSRMNQLMDALEVGVKHIKASGKKNINIVLLSEFGRNVYYNNALGWDHGNLQNIYWLGGWDYFKHLGIVGETGISDSSRVGRIYHIPKNFGKSNESYHFQVFSVATTLYKLYGIKNPEILTNNNPIIKDIFS